MKIATVTGATERKTPCYNDLKVTLFCLKRSIDTDYMPCFSIRKQASYEEKNILYF